MSQDLDTEGLAKAYEPISVEEKWYKAWIDGKCFAGDPSSEKEGYSIVIPPPNVTGILHLGHVLNNTIQDVLARRARMQGKEVMWLPGTDHAGIATQTKVERELKKSTGQSRRDMGREAFLKKVWEWKDEHGGIIIKQLKRLGCSCDWDRERFTMDEDYTHWVSHTFSDLFKKGMIYRGKRMVNWCPVSLTALSDEEVIMKPQQSKLYFMKYEFVDAPGEFLEISTTRPETLMGDVAVAVNPKDERFAQAIGRKVRRPFPEAEIPVIADEHVDVEFGTGALKITPAHDKADFEIGVRHNLEIIDCLTAEGKINCEAVPELHGQDRFAARKIAAQMLEDKGLLIRAEDYANKVGFSERADVPIEPRISMQWFLRYPEIERTAVAVASNEITFRPERWSKTFAHWMSNIQDWCISRQLWWGHQIPVWYRKDKSTELQDAESLDLADMQSGDIHVGIEPPADAENWVRDEDVLDTWFSSWLWPFATMAKQGEENDLLKKFYPTSDLVTGPDILFFWVARMIMAGYSERDELPFKNVFFTSLIRDGKGRKMSKSLGNSPDPIEIMDKYGSDGLRFTLMRIAPLGGDIRFVSKEEDGELVCPQVEEGRNFANKIYNACRFRQMGGGVATGTLDVTSLKPYHVNLLAKLDTLEANLETAYADYKFNEVCNLLYEFLWNEFCDLFLEAVKGDLRDTAADADRQATLMVFDKVMSRYFLLLHPFMPHLTEELSLRMGYISEGEFVMQTQLPSDSALAGCDASEAQKISQSIYDAAGRLRNVKAEYNVATRRDVTFIAKTSVDYLEEESAVLCQLAGAGEIQIDPSYDAPKGTPVAVTSVGEIYMPLAGLIDVEAEKARLDKEIEKNALELKKSTNKLSNEKFVANAKPEVVQIERDRLTEWETKANQLAEMRAALDT